MLTDDDVRHLGEGDLLQTDGFATPDEVQTWSAAISARQAEFTLAGTGRERHRDPAIRSDRIAWASDFPGVFDDLRARFMEVRTELNAAAWMGLVEFDVQLAAYGPGGRYAAHRDALRHDPKREATAILYLNPDWKPADEGCLRVYTAAGSFDVEPLGGRLVVFRSSLLLHEVRPTQAVRHAATAWYRGPRAL